MVIDFEILPRDLTEAFEIDKTVSRIMGNIADELPQAGFDILNNPPPSVKGGHPAKQSGHLAGSFDAIESGGEILMEFAYYGAYHDPFFEGEIKGGGWTNHPFLEDVVDLSVSRALPKSLL